LDLLKKKPLPLKVFKRMRKDRTITDLIKAAGNLTKRMRYNDHGIVHALITTEYGIRLHNYISELTEPTVMREGNKIDESLAVVVAGCYLHDVGCSVHRDDHDIVGVGIANQLLKDILPSKLIPHTLEGVMCHMANYKASSTEAGIVTLADGCDIAEGRARMPQKGKFDMHSISTKAVEWVDIKKNKKSVLIWIKINNESGIFQVEQILVPKLEAANLGKWVDVVVQLKDEKIRYNV
jgi:metal-dependent HD superfamily phosphatase/phosphodiesterase